MSPPRGNSWWPHPRATDLTAERSNPMTQASNARAALEAKMKAAEAPPEDTMTQRQRAMANLAKGGVKQFLVKRVDWETKSNTCGRPSRTWLAART